jgi:hypothetical protein
MVLVGSVLLDFVLRTLCWFTSAGRSIKQRLGPAPDKSDTYLSLDSINCQDERKHISDFRFLGQVPD